jgi:hypothetical protein
LTSGQKKKRSRLLGKVKALEYLEHKDELNVDEQVKLKKLEFCRKELDDLERRFLHQAESAVKDLVDHPPAPLTDMQCHDEHRVWFGGRNTKKMYEGVWKDMPATCGYQSTQNTTASFFRDLVVNPDTLTNGK